MTMIAINLPDGAFSALRKDPREMEAELRLAAAAKWYELGLVSQEPGGRDRRTDARGLHAGAVPTGRLAISGRPGRR